LAALRTGSGLVVIAAPSSVAPTIRAYSPNLIVHSLSGNNVSPCGVDELSKLFRSSDALVLGPGIGLNPETREAIPLIIETAAQNRKPILIDADAIRALSESKHLLRDANAVITPHVGEFRTICGMDVPNGLRQRAKLCKRFAMEYSVIVLLKGHNTVVSDGHHVKINRTGNPGMAVGGTGDVLSGIIGAFLAQGADRFFSAAAGAYLHGLAGDLVCKHKGFHMVASDLIEALPNVLQRYDRESQG
jgi:NAD(P)H-hydrate epimerase